MPEVNEEVSMTCEDFCQELGGFAETTFTRIYRGEPASRIISRTSNLTLLADLSPLCVGHLLLVSNRHYLSFAEVMTRHQDEVESATTALLDLYSGTFGTPVILEHGSVAQMEKSACITHAHWHILPLDGSRLAAQMDADGLSHLTLATLAELAEVADRRLPYFYLSCEGYRRVYGIGRRMRQQYLRAVAGASLGIPDPEWDWAVVVRRDDCRTTLRQTAGWPAQLL